MDCTELRRHVADRLDDLLEAEDARAFDAHVASCPRCAVALAEGERMRALLYAPFAVSPPPGDLAERVRARAPRPPLGRLLRYAASFAAGVLVTLAVTALRAAPAPAPADPRVGEPLLGQQAPAETISYVFPRRIR